MCSFGLRDFEVTFTTARALVMHFPACQKIASHTQFLFVPDDSGRILVLQRAKQTTRCGYWCLPGGKIDYGDTVEQAVARELREETGLRVTDLRFLFYQDSLPRDPGQMHCINLHFECSVEGTLELNGESTESRWIGKQKLPQLDIAFRNDDALARYWNDCIGPQRTP
jgi:8-oxo-dGTP diphosphatase